MAKPEVVLPPVVREKAAQLGNAGAAWLSGLPALINDLERRWSVTIGEPLNGGTASYVARTRTADGTDAVVKLLSLIHISEPTRQAEISYAVFCLKKKNT